MWCGGRGGEGHLVCVQCGNEAAWCCEHIAWNWKQRVPSPCPTCPPTAAGHMPHAPCLKAPVAPHRTPPTLTLGVIKSRLEPVGLSTDAAGLERLGFKPAATQGAAKLFHERDWPLMLAAMVAGLEAIQAKQAA